MKVAIVNLGQIVSGNWRDPFASGDTIITEGERIVSVGTAASGTVEGAAGEADVQRVHRDRTLDAVAEVHVQARLVVVREPAQVPEG